MAVSGQQIAELTDEALMEAYQLGNSEAFVELYGRLSPRVYGYLRNRLPSQVETDDVFQQVFLKFHKSRGSYEKTYSLAPWLYAICRSVLTDHFRRGSRERQNQSAHLAFVHSQVLDTPVANSLGMFEEQSLTAKQLEVLRLRFEHDLSFTQIAERLKTTPGNARQLVSRAVRRLSCLLKVRGENE